MAQINLIKAILLIFFVTFFNLNLLTASTGQEWTFECSTLDERHTHELFCFRYYECKEDDVGNWEIYLRSCPQGRIFKETAKRCEVGNCTDPCSRSSLFSGTQAWDFQCLSNNERHQHETNCSRFYWCVEDNVGGFQTLVDSCPPGRIFNETVGRCQTGECPAPTPIPCDQTTTPTQTSTPTTTPTQTSTPTTTPTQTPTSTTTPTQTPTSTTTRAPPFTCVGKPTGHYPHPENCIQYYKCLNFEATLHTCPTNAKFFDDSVPTCRDSCEHCWNPALCP